MPSKKMHDVSVDEPPDPRELRRRKLVRRSHFIVIAAAWLITVPAAAILAASIYIALSYLN